MTHADGGNVKRYRPDISIDRICAMIYDDNGEWVRHDDYARLEQRVRDLTQATAGVNLETVTCPECDTSFCVPQTLRYRAEQAEARMKELEKTIEHWTNRSHMK